MSILVVAVMLAVGVALRVVSLDRVPLGFDQDEACNGYDAYSIGSTGRDQHGNFLPILFQGFNDYRMPLLDYSLVPLVGAFGLKPAVVRLGAAIWGIVDLVAITILAGLLLGWHCAAAAALLGALSPWHLTLSRYGIEATAASAMVSLAMVCFFLWLRWRRDSRLLLSGVFFGLSLYSYSITKAFTPFAVGLLGLLYWRELRLARGKALLALAIVLLLAAPQVVLLLLHPAETQAQFRHLSIFNYMSLHNRGSSRIALIANFGANWLSYFTPSYLFLSGDRGDHWTLIHPLGFGQLLPEQAPLIALALVGLVGARRRKLGVLLIGWVILTALPAGLTVPLGSQHPEPRAPPTPWILFNQLASEAPLTPSLLLAHPDSRHDALAIAPWILLSALGFAVLLDFAAKRSALGMAAVGLLLAGALFHGARFVDRYFSDYPIVAAPYFQYGMEQVVRAIDKLGDRHEPVIISDRINQPYIYVLFFERYAPAVFQNEKVLYGKPLYPPNLFAPVLLFDRYVFVDPLRAYGRLEHGIFVFPGNENPPAPPVLSIRYPDGAIAYNIVVK